MASCVRVFEVLIENGSILTQEPPEDFVCAEDLDGVSHVEVVE